MNKPPHFSILASANQLWFLLVASLLLVYGIMSFTNSGVVISSDWRSGFTHPLHGGDHFLTMLAVGIWAAQLRGKAIWLLPVTFVGVMSLGGLAGVAGIFIPGAEPIILVSCLVFSFLVIRKIRFTDKINVLIVAFFAFFHGFAHGQEISTSASLISYTLGFMVATLLLHGTGILIVRLLVVIFALFLGYLACTQLTGSFSDNKLFTGNQNDNSHELVVVRDIFPPPDVGYKQNSLLVVDNYLIAQQLQKYYRRLAEFMHPKIARVHCPSMLTSFAGVPQTGIQFSSNGVGLASPPVAYAVSDTFSFNPCITVHNLANLAVTINKPAPETAFGFNFLQSAYQIATSLLTNGTGATSPPTAIVIAVILSRIINESAFSNSYPIPGFTVPSLTKIPALLPNTRKLSSRDLCRVCTLLSLNFFNQQPA
jgi:hydrogenase/urease accessory protein HupE